MFRLWARTFQNNHMLQDTCIEDGSDDTRTHKIFRALDEETGALTCTESAEAPFGLPRQLERLRLLCRPGDVSPVEPDPLVASDYEEREHPRGPVLPGPFAAFDSVSLLRLILLP